MLTKPQHGWTDFSLDQSYTYGLSYLDDIPFEWLDQAIHGLETLLPFCVKGFMEPGRMLCLVSYWTCYTFVEYAETADGAKKNIRREPCYYNSINFSMLDFCRALYNDISSCPEEWASFVDYHGEDYTEKQRLLLEKLARLKELIEKNEEAFDNSHCFL